MDVAAQMREANKLLAPEAVPHEGRLGRSIPESEDTMRFPFQRDRDRIIHTQAFRRLQGKTQVFVAGEGDHYRTRLTHTMEVAQISRDLARALRLNEDLAECIALAHDLGHPPFGHTGEDALDAWMREHDARFEHNEQSFRIVVLLETHAIGVPGLNLHREILEALQKHAPIPPSTLEAELVNVADEIAYTSHDCDDGLTGSLFAWEDLLTVSLARRAEERRRGRGTSIRGALISLMAEDLVEQAERLKLNAAKLHFDFSSELRDQLAELRAFLHERMYFHPAIRAPADRGRNIVLLLCKAYEEHPPEKILQRKERTHGTLIEAIKDYVAGMTDRYAEEQAKALGLIEG